MIIMRPLSFNLKFYAIILTLSLNEVTFLNTVSAFSPSRSTPAVSRVTATVLSTALPNGKFSFCAFCIVILYADSKKLRGQRLKKNCIINRPKGESVEFEKTRA